MTWTYDVRELQTNGKDTVRLLLGDTDDSEQLLQDEEISAFLAGNANVYKAAWKGAQAIAALFARRVDKSVGDLHLSASQKHTQYEAIACDMRRQFLIGAVTPYASGLSIAEKEAVEDEADRVPPSFRREQFIYPGTESPSDPLVQEVLPS